MVVTPKHLEKRLEKEGKEKLDKLVKYVDKCLKEGYCIKGAEVRIYIDEMGEAITNGVVRRGYFKTEELKAIFGLLYAPKGWDISCETDESERFDEEGYPLPAAGNYFVFKKKEGEEKPRNLNPEENALEVICRGY